MNNGCPLTNEIRISASPDPVPASVPSAEDVVRAYFARMQAGDRNVHELFHEDAVLNGLGRRRTGREAIRRFYGRAIDEGAPQPRLVGPLLGDGSRVAAEIHIDLTDGQTLHVMDLFDVEAGRIRCLTYFLAQAPRER